MYPHERSLVADKKSEKFVLLGINNDSSRYKLRAAIEREKLTWPVIWQGQSRHVDIKWNVNAWPTIYVIDAKGIIRAEGPRGDVLTQWVDSLLDELKRGKPPAKKKK